MRVFILALDGLEYTLLKKWRCRYLLQRQHGTFKVSEEYFHKEGVPCSPKVWASFITGKKPQEHGVRDWWVYGKVLDRIKYLPVIRHIKGKRKILWRLGLKPRIVDRSDIKCETIFDVVRPSIAVYVPAYNDSTEFHIRLLEAVPRHKRVH